MKKFMLLFMSLLFAVAMYSPPVEAQSMTLPGLEVKPGSSYVDILFTASTDSAIGYVPYFESKEGTYYAQRDLLSGGPPGVWTTASFAFNKAGTAPSGYGPTKRIYCGGLYGALQCDGQINRCVIAICRLASNGVPISVLGYSQVVNFAAPQLNYPIKRVITEPYPGAPPAYSPTPTPTPAVTTPTPTTIKKGSGGASGNGTGK